MKNLIFKLFIVILFLGFTFMSCEKDKVDKESSFLLNDVNHKTTHGYKIFYNATDTTSLHYVLLCSEGIDFSMTEDISGYGDVVVFVLLSESPTDLISGKYTYDDSMMGFVLLSYDSDLDEGVEYQFDNLGASSVDLKVSGTTYEFDYSLTLETGKVLKGYYKGSLEQISPPAVKSSKEYFFEKLTYF